MKSEMVMLCAAALAIGAGAGCGSSVTDPPGSSTDECTGFEDAQSSSPVTLRFRNDTSIAVYLSGGCGATGYTLEPASGSDGTAYTFGTSCLQTCEDLQSESPMACADDCALVTWEIPAGGTRDFVWNGLGLLGGVQMPAACRAESNGAGSCQQIVQAKADSYRVAAMGYAECEGDCTCDADGMCFGQATGAQASTTPMTFDFPTATLVEIVFDVCAFGCADDSSSDDATGPGGDG